VIPTTSRSAGLGRLADQVWTAVLAFAVNPFGWRRHASFHVTALLHSPRMPLFGSWYLAETNETASADIVMETDRIGRRRVRIRNLNGLYREDVRKSPAYVAATRWTVTGDDTILKGVRA
jgi:hypothetical protein